MRRWLIAGAALVAAPLAVLLVIAAFGVPVSAAPWRDRIGAVASAALGREVTLEGPLELVLGLRTRLSIGGVRIANPPGFATPAFAELGAAHAEVDLWPVLRGRLRIRTLDAENVKVWLERSPDGDRNWVFEALSHAAEDEEGSGVAVRIGQMSLRSLAVEYHSGARTRYFDLDALDAEGAWSRPIRASVRGRVEKQFPYVLTLDGGPGRLFYRGDEPWPFTLDLEFAGTRLHASGTANTRIGETEIFFGLGTEDLAQIERLAQTRLPKVGVTSLAGRITARADSATLGGIRGVMGASELTGHIEIAHGGERPRLTGELELSTLDLRPFLAGDAGRHSGTKLTGDMALEHDAFDLGFLTLADADVRLSVARWLGLFGDVRDAELDVQLEGGRLSAPLLATVAEVPVSGRLDLDGAAPVPAVALELSAERSPLGRLAEVFTGLPGIDGTLGHFELRLGGSGATLGALARDLELKLAVANAKLSYGNVAGGRPVELALDALDVSIARGKQLRGTGRGALAGERVTAELRGGDAPGMLRTASSPIDLQVRGAGVTLALAGVLARPEATRGTDLKFSLEGRRAGDLARWLGTAPGANAPVAVAGHARIGSDEWHLDELRLKLGRSELVVDAHRTGIGAGKQPIIGAAVRSPLVDVPELESLFPAAAQTKSAGTIEVPILPHGINLADADIGVGLERVAFARGDLTNAGVVLRLRGGRMEPSAFGASFAGVPVAGTIALDLRGKLPELAVAMGAENVDLGAMLRTMRLAEDLDAQVEALRVQVLGRGGTLSELLAGSSIEARIEGGEWRIRGPAGRRVLADIRLKEAYASAPAGSPLTVRVDGTLGDAPIAVRVTSGTLADFGPAAKFAPFSATAETAGARLALDGRVALPVTQTTAALKFVLSGERLDTLNGLAGTRLPPWGPWSVSGPVEVTPTAYRVPDLDVRVGASRLAGSGRIDLAQERARLEMKVSAPSVQLDDFKLDGWSPVEERSAAPTGVEALRDQAKGAAARAQALASADVLARFDADLDVAVAEVRSGADRMGDGHLRAQVTEGRLFIGPAEVNIPGGTVRLSLLYEPSAAGVRVRTGAYIENFDYGILARRIRPGTAAEGRFSMNLELGSRAPALAKVMEHANGRIDVAVWPKRLSSGVFDLWAVNVFLALLPQVDPSSEPVVNCVVARFNLRDGKLSDDAILLDTSRMRVGGKGGADFRDETLAFRLQPQAKRPQLFSLATPVDVTGTFTDFHVGPSVGDVLLTLGRFFGSLVVVPFEWLTEGPIPRDGADVCTDPLRPKRDRRR
ncbi:MAG TPA: AsmA family protein [Burkholderiales bacterium]|nr:AsmA family protein [Burkholderiales bacterium]